MEINVKHTPLTKNNFSLFFDILLCCPVCLRANLRRAACLQLQDVRPHLGLHAAHFPRLLSGLTQQVGSDFYHRGRVVLHSRVLEVDHVLLHAVLYVVLQLQHRGKKKTIGLSSKVID